MSILLKLGVLLVSYLIGSIPFGLLVVKLIRGIDIRLVGSGRTGGTNAFRAAGLGAGLLTALLDILKAASTVWLARALTPDVWTHILAPLAATLGHNYSIFLIERQRDGKIRLRGGAGGATAFGGTLGLWPPALFIMLPIGLLLWWGIGYASVTTMSIGLMAMLIFIVRAILGLSPWQYVLYGIVVELILLWALRPNIQRLIEGTERRHGLPVYLEKRRQERRSGAEKATGHRGVSSR